MLLSRLYFEVVFSVGKGDVMRKFVLVFGLGVVTVLCGHSASASPLGSGNWIQVGYMAPDGNNFSGNCNLSAAGCNYGPDASGDFWIPFPETYVGQEILFITGDQQYWASGNYAAVAAIVSAKEGVFSPNMNWSDAGIAGASVGSVTGNILYRAHDTPPDPWVTLRGSHCAHLTADLFPVVNDCNLVLWGEFSPPSTGTVQNSLNAASGGVEVYISSAVPEPNTALLLGFGLVGLGVKRRSRRQAVLH